MHIAEEHTKFGLDENELYDTIASPEFKALTNIKIKGLMGMATFTPDQNQIKKEFGHLKSVFDKTKGVLPELTILSMGMSGDYQIAMDEGSTMIRVGSSIFGARNYQ